MTLQGLRLGECSQCCLPWAHEDRGTPVNAQHALDLAPSKPTWPVCTRRCSARCGAPTRFSRRSPATSSARAASASGPRSRSAPRTCRARCDPGERGRDHGRRLGRARASGLALPRRRHRRSRDAARCSQRERAVEQHRRDPRGRLPLGARLRAGVVARRRRCGPPRHHDRRALPRAGRGAPAPLRRRPLGRALRVGDRGQDRSAVRHVLPRGRHGRQASPTTRSMR